MFQACVLTLYGDRSPSSGRSQACRLPLHIYIERNPKTVKSITSFPYIVRSL
jgi:hypothetical protein